MYIESSFPQQENDKARLISPEYTITTGGSCLQFFYHMWGSGTGTLNVLLMDGADMQPIPLWSLKGDQGDLWRPARATIKAKGQFQVNKKTPNMQIYKIICLGYLRRYCWSKFLWRYIPR
jgi:hypothetical protein